MSLLWKKDPVPDEATAFQRTAAGIAYLDHRFGPDWDRTLNLDVLDIGSPFRCVLGQLGPWRFVFNAPPAVACGFSTGVWSDVMFLVWRAAPLARSFERLTYAWKVLVRQRRHERDVQARLLEARSATTREVVVATEPAEPSGGADSPVGNIV